MSRNQRVALLAVAALIAVVAFVALQPNDDQTPASDPQQTAAPETTATPASDDSTATSGDGPDTEPEDDPKHKRRPKPPLLVAGKERTLIYSKGETVRFRVRHPSDEEVHVHGYDISKELPAGRTVTVRFAAELEGIFEVELEHSHTPLGFIRVEP